MVSHALASSTCLYITDSFHISPLPIGPLLLEATHPGMMPLALVIDDRVEVWEASSQPHVLQVWASHMHACMHAMARQGFYVLRWFQ